MGDLEMDTKDLAANIKVVGVGGGSCGVVNRMIMSGMRSAEFIAINTDSHILSCSHAPTRIQIGSKLTNGDGAGGNPEIGEQSAEENREQITDALRGADVVFIAAGMGGGTGTGAAPVVAECAKEIGALTVGFVTKPFPFESKRRVSQAEAGIAKLIEKLDTLIVVPLERILQMVDKNTSMTDGLKLADEILGNGVRSISDPIAIPGFINICLQDAKSVMSNAGLAYMGVGKAKGEGGVMAAAKAAIESPLLGTSIDGARGLLFNIAGGKNLSLFDVTEAAETITSTIDKDANVFFGTAIDETMMGDDVTVTVIATGVEKRPAKGLLDGKGHRFYNKKQPK